VLVKNSAAKLLWGVNVKTVPQILYFYTPANTMDTFNLNRFVTAQAHHYALALQEVKAGRKTSHWMWFIFPQIKGLGFSDISQLYAIQSKQEAAAYLLHETLGARLVEISNALLALDTNDAFKVFGSPDNMKLKSCMTLFNAIEGTPQVFQQVLYKYFGGNQDEKTLAILASL